MKHNFNKPISYCGSCGHFNKNGGTFSFCLVQDREVWEADYCDRHASKKEAKEWFNKEFQYMGTIFDRGDGRANFKNKE